MLTFFGYIDGIHGTPYIPYMDPMRHCAGRHGSSPEASQSAATEPGAHGAVAKAGASPGACQKVFGPGPEVDFDGGLICLMVDSWCLLEVNGVEWCLMVFNGTGYGYYEWC